MAKGWRKPKSRCSERGCGVDAVARGFCPGHYEAKRRTVGFGQADCTEQGCSRPSVAHGLCTKHYQRYLNGSTGRERIVGDDGARYESYVDRSAGRTACHPWTGGTIDDGYGRIWIGSAAEGRLWLAHRYGFQRTVGPIPDGMLVCHRCDNPPCQNSLHWFLGTDQDNSDDKVAKGRHKREKASC